MTSRTGITSCRATKFTDALQLRPFNELLDVEKCNNFRPHDYRRAAVLNRDYTVKTAVEGDFLRVTVEGKHSVERSKRLIDSLGQETGRLNVKKVLIDARRMDGDMSTWAKFQTGEYAAGVLNVKIACMFRKEIIDHFGEAVAANRGMRVRIFDNEPDALVWLQSG